LETYGQDSQEYLIVRLYGEMPARDDYSGILYAENKNNIDDTKNYIVVPKGNVCCEVIINEFKTASIYGTIQKKLSNITSQLLRRFIKNKKIVVGGNIFPNNLGRFISKMNKKIGEKGINFIRHSIISTLHNKVGVKDTEILDLIELLGHRTSTL
jgi:hypothetical protein